MSGAGRILGVGGVFLRSADPDALRAWYARVLGLELEGWGGVVFPPLTRGVTVWSPFAADTAHFDPSRRETMLNFVVDDLDAVLARVAREGVEVLGRDAQDGQGRFAWILDPEGLKIELWEPEN